jgi:ABC-type Fe3+-hydroxamate transport system substrate-binding protein
VSAAEIEQADPDLILLPSEPYPFGERDLGQIAAKWPEMRAVRKQRIILVDGTLITWPGTRLGRALRQLPAILGS